MNRIFIIHGWEGSPEGNWFPWLKYSFQGNAFAVTVPVMPSPASPNQDEWVQHLREVIGQPDAHTYLIGHSLGATAILRYVESLPEGQKIGGVVSVAGFSEPIGIKELDSFFAVPLDYERVKERIGHIVTIQSMNDPYVPVKQGEILRDKLGAELILVPDGGHLNKEAGYMELPIVRDSILKLARINLFSTIRDIPYRIPLSLMDIDQCCTGKHKLFLKGLADLGISAHWRVCSFRWSQMGLPNELLQVPHEDDSTHAYLEVEIDDKWIAVDATWDSGLQNILPVNDWDGFSDIAIAVQPVEKFSLEQSQQIMENENLKETENDLKKNGAFYAAFNEWLERIRNQA